MTELKSVYEHLAWIAGAPPELVPGMVVRYRDHAVYLVGDVNQVGGSCSCCTAVDSVQVVEYAWLTGFGPVLASESKEAL